ncbi:hypothetical protein ACIHCM_10190 [Streptomyces sp. NPDC052023]|uniref:hypothetical protein n=1 Tax=Streptomyces sp. NPDC052023 TaxID=3365681 RepID=UPI0037CF254B
MDASHEAARGLTDIEGFLYWEAHHRSARRRAADFVARVSGLSEKQKAEIEWWYVQEQLCVCRSMRQHITDHITAVEEHHAQRYSQLRRGAYAASTLLTTLMLALCVVVILGTAG